MTRSRVTAKQAGTKHETAVVRWLAEVLADDRIERRAKNGAKDRGDVSGVRTIGGGRVVLECKDAGGRFEVGSWLTETETERGNDDAVAGFVVAKRRGTTDPGDQVVIGTLRDLVALLVGERRSA